MGKYTLKRQKEDIRDYGFEKLGVLIKPVIPSLADLRPKMPKVYDQGQLGSCTANSTSAYRVYLGEDIELELSRLFQYYESRAIEGTVNQDSGATNRDAVKSVYKNGICEEKYFKYDITKFTVAPSSDAIENAKKYKIATYHAVTGLTQMKQALAHELPVVLGMEVFKGFESQQVARTGIMSMPTINEENLGGHSVLVVGYVDNTVQNAIKFPQLFNGKKTKGYLIIRNSWGETWGDKGYFYMPYEFISKYTFDYWTMQM